MRTVSCYIIAAIVATGSAIGQNSKSETKVLTVCDVLGHWSRYASSSIAVVGRIERAVSLIDQYEYLSQDKCEHPVVIHGHVWLNKIQIWTAWEDGMPKPPSNRPGLNRSLLARKLSIIRRTTELGSYRRPQFKTEGHSLTDTGTTVAPNEWGVVYGRIMRVAGVDKDCDDGCGGDVPLAIISEPYSVQSLGEDGTLLKEEP